MESHMKTEAEIGVMLPHTEERGATKSWRDKEESLP